MSLWCFWKSFRCSSFSLRFICRLSIIWLISLFKETLVVKVVWFLYSATDICWQTADSSGGHIPFCAHDMCLLKSSLRWAGTINICCWFLTMNETNFSPETLERNTISWPLQQEPVIDRMSQNSLTYSFNIVTNLKKVFSLPLVHACFCNS